jgi:hypothetical protein
VLVIALEAVSNNRQAERLIVAISLATVQNQAMHPHI